MVEWWNGGMVEEYDEARGRQSISICTELLDLEAAETGPISGEIEWK